ncbi:MFS transporter [Aspergillus ruber CBS 135680]|uniref:Polyamine transporter n=1 Tax=Aspergillus ruber (strain CBS 135680) TaxID=1388766 RepID=A0A017S1A8_ASPRC|nr:polyamine transporter [Aspergillus ruber CBS 135680]EYE90838.1 polyamine transporter [Aspergillus ruber CBS 135680]
MEEGAEQREDAVLLLSEEEALAKARENPDEALNIYVTYAEHDRDNPRNWPKWRKWWITCLVSSLNIVTTWCAGGISSGATGIQKEFGVSAEVTTLCLSMYVLGYAVGPVLLAPLSEYFGRQPVYAVSWFLLFIFQLPLALAPNIGTIIVCRFIAGLVGGAPLTNTGGSISDLWVRNESGGPMAVYGLSSTFGPPMALVVTGYIALDLGWRYIFWVLMAVTGGFWVILVLTVPETRHTTILDRKAKRVAKTMKKENLQSAQTTLSAHAANKKGLHELFAITLTRPVRFLITEPITFFCAIYNGFLYGLVYLFNEAFPLVFGEGHGFNVGAQGLSFLGLAIGPLIAFCLYPLQERYYLRRVRENDGKGVPEARMWMARLGALFIPISLFWFGWTSYSSVHWIVPIIASSFFGAGIYIVILSILNYVVDAYQTYSASALAGVILARNLVGGGFPLFATQMYNKLGYEWASSLLGFIAILLVPIPFIFFYMGRAIRLRSPWARQHFDQTDDNPH